MAINKRTAARRARRTVIAILLLTLALLGCEAAARRVRPLRVADYLASSPPVFQRSPFYSPEFLAERLSLLTYFDDEGAIRYRDFQGKYFSFHNAMRGTGSTPKHPGHTVYMFGNSTLLDLYAPDSYTIAGQLQSQLGNDWLVVNNSAPSVDTGWALRRTRETPLRAGDVVIWYTASDASAPYYTAQHDHLPDLPFFCPHVLDYILLSSLLDLTCSESFFQPSAEYDDPVWFNAQVQVAAKAWREHIDAGAAFAEARGARLIVVLPPNIFTRPLSAAERHTLWSLRTPVAMGKSYHATYPLMAGPHVLDLSHALDPLRAEGVEVFVDSIHVADAGDAVIAQAIYDAVRPAL